jgi:hypothetical protein
MPGEPSRRRSGRSHEAFGDGRPRGMVITVPGIAPRGGTEPGLQAVWRLVTVDPSADQFGISALSRGQPCGRQILSLLLEIDRLACRRVVDLQGFAAVTWRSGH